MCLLKLIDDIKYDIAKLENNDVHVIDYNLYFVDGLFCLYIGLEFHQDFETSKTIESITNIVAASVTIQGLDNNFNGEYIFSTDRVAGWINYSFNL